VCWARLQLRSSGVSVWSVLPNRLGASTRYTTPGSNRAGRIEDETNRGLDPERPVPMRFVLARDNVSGYIDLSLFILSSFIIDFFALCFLVLCFDL
jgi:hypothetical protein